MKVNSVLILLLASLLSTAVYSQDNYIEWKVANLPSVDSIKGAPTKVNTVLGEAVSFDGEKDGYFLGVNPLQGMEELTLEVIFKPDGDGPFAQRFMHLGLLRGERIMFETRVTPDKTWYFDAHTASSNGKSLTLIDENLTHPTDRWYNATLVARRDKLTTYVNGVKQLEGNLEFLPVNKGISSVGVRQNLVSWFKGTIYKVRVTPRVLSPEEFQKDYVTLNEQQ